MTVLACCPLCGEEGEAWATPGLAATLMVECSRCGQVFDIAPPADPAALYEQ